LQLRLETAEAMTCSVGRLQLHTTQQGFFVLQLDKAQDAFIAWQNAGKGSSERRRLQPEIEEECKSIAWQVFYQAFAWCC